MDKAQQRAAQTPIVAPYATQAVPAGPNPFRPRGRAGGAPSPPVRPHFDLASFPSGEHKALSRHPCALFWGALI